MFRSFNGTYTKFSGDEFNLPFIAGLIVDRKVGEGDWAKDEYFGQLTVDRKVRVPVGFNMSVRYHEDNGRFIRRVLGITVADADILEPGQVYDFTAQSISWPIHAR